MVINIHTLFTNRSLSKCNTLKFSFNFQVKQNQKIPPIISLVALYTMISNEDKN